MAPTAWPVTSIGKFFPPVDSVNWKRKKIQAESAQKDLRKNKGRPGGRPDFHQALTAHNMLTLSM